MTFDQNVGDLNHMQCTFVSKVLGITIWSMVVLKSGKYILFKVESILVGVNDVGHSEF